MPKLCFQRAIKFRILEVYSLFQNDPKIATKKSRRTHSKLRALLEKKLLAIIAKGALVFAFKTAGNYNVFFATLLCILCYDSKDFFTQKFLLVFLSQHCFIVGPLGVVENPLWVLTCKVS